MAKSQEIVGFGENLPAEYVDFGEDAGRGLENASRNELVTPFLTQLHYQCPQIADGDEQYIEGARPGMLFNTATRQLSSGKDGVEIVPVYREAIYTEWTPRDEGGGFHGTCSPTDPEVMRLVSQQGRFKRLITDEGTELVEQYNLYLLYAANGEPITVDNAQEAVIAFTSTRIAPYRGFFTLASAIQYPSKNGPVKPPLWAHRWRLRTVGKKNDQGAWFTYDIALVDPRPTPTTPVSSLVKTTDPLYARAKSFADLLRQGAMTADYAAQQAADGDNEIPF